jgi:hypothetical protein
VSTDYSLVCFDCKEDGPIFASSSIAYGYKVWDIERLRAWLGHREAIGKHEGHDLRILHQDADRPWDDDEEPVRALHDVEMAAEWDGTIEELMMGPIQLKNVRHVGHSFTEEELRNSIEDFMEKWRPKEPSALGRLASQPATAGEGETIKITTPGRYKPEEPA